jgi:hypothetical protein
MSKRIEWSDYLGNSATALEIVRQFSESGEGDLAEWCEAQHDDIWPDSAINVEWCDVAHALLKSAVDDRMRQDDLGYYEAAIVYDWTEGDNHLLWVATAPRAQIVSWAESVQEAQKDG